MSTDPHALFKQLDPPAGGAEKLRRRLDAAARGRRAPGRPVVVTVSAAAAIVVAAVAFFLDGDRNANREPVPAVALHDAPQFDRLLGRPREATEPSVALNDRTAKVAQIRTAKENVRIYRLE